MVKQLDGSAVRVESAVRAFAEQYAARLRSDTQVRLFTDCVLETTTHRPIVDVLLDPHQTFASSRRIPGTRQIARRLGYSPPRGVGSDALSRMRANVVVVEGLGPATRLGSVIVAAERGLPWTSVQCGFLHKVYWEEEGARSWLVVTTAEYDLTVAGNTLFLARRCAGNSAPPAVSLDLAAEIVREREGRSLIDTLADIACLMDVRPWEARQLLWTAIWLGRVPLDLSRPLTFNSTLKLLPIDRFWHQNPITSSRTAWPH